MRHSYSYSFLTASLMLLASCGADQKPPAFQMPPPPVGVATAISRTLPMTRELTGHLEAINVVDLKPRVSGTVEKVFVSDGAEVKAGDVILEVDRKPLEATAAHADADVARAEARLAQVRSQFNRAKQLVDTKVISQQTYDDNESAVKTAEAELTAAKSAQIAARLDLGYAQVTSPINGRIGKIKTTVGNLVQGGGPVPATLIATIVSIDPVDAVFDLDEATWQMVGERLRTSANGGASVPAQVGLAGEKGYPHQGAVTFVDNQIDGASGAIRIRAKIPNSDHRLLPGAFARIALELEAPRPVLLVHERAVQAQLTTRYVLVVDDQGGTQFRPVHLGATVDQLRVIESGLGPNDRIAVNNLSKIFFPGMPVSPIPASMLTLENEGAPAAGSPGAPPAGHDDNKHGDATTPAVQPEKSADVTNKPAAGTPAGAKPGEGTKP